MQDVRSILPVNRQCLWRKLNTNQVSRKCSWHESQPPREVGFLLSRASRPRKQKKTTIILGSAVHLALRAPQPREAYIFAKTPFSWFLTGANLHLSFASSHPLPESSFGISLGYYFPLFRREFKGQQNRGNRTESL